MLAFILLAYTAWLGVFAVLRYAVAIFLAGAVVVGQVPWLAERVDEVLDHAY